MPGKDIENRSERRFPVYFNIIKGSGLTQNERGRNALPMRFGDEYDNDSGSLVVVPGSVRIPIY